MTSQPIPIRRAVQPFPLAPCYCGGHAWLALTKGFVTILDVSDIDLVSDRSWHTSHKRKNFYAASTGNGRTVRMHKLILPGDHLIDHRNGNSLDNRRCNLRAATIQSNAWNTRSHIPAKWPFRGIKQERSGRFSAAYYQYKKAYHLGTFDTPEEAARAYDKTILALRGEFAVLNFPEEHGEVG